MQLYVIATSLQPQLGGHVWPPFVPNHDINVGIAKSASSHAYSWLLLHAGQLPVTEE